MGSAGTAVGLVERDLAGLRDELVVRHVRRRALVQPGDPDLARESAEEVVDGLVRVSRAFDVVVHGAPAGWVWVRRDEDLLALLDAEADPALGADVRSALLDLARAQGATSIDVGVAAVDALRRAVVEGGGFALQATTMWLDLAATEPRPPSELRLDPMGDAEFEVFRRDQETSYAAERAASGEPPERAARVAREQLAGLLPDGRHSTDQHFFTGLMGEEPVGTLWLAARGPGVFVYDVVVAEQQRGRGLGRALMAAAEGWARERGAIGVGLNVFGQNVVARRLYDSLGYTVLEEYWQLPVGG